MAPRQEGCCLSELHGENTSCAARSCTHGTAFVTLLSAILSSCCHKGSPRSSLGHTKSLQFLPLLSLSSLCLLEHFFAMLYASGFLLDCFKYQLYSLDPNACSTLFTLHPDKRHPWQHPGFKVRMIQIYLHSPQHGQIFHSSPKRQLQIFSSASLYQPTQN